MSWTTVMPSRWALPGAFFAMILSPLRCLEYRESRTKCQVGCIIPFHKCFDEGVLIRVTADTIALSPPLIVERNQIDRIFGTIDSVLKTVD